MLTAAQLTGLQFDAPADLAAATTASFTYSVSDGTTTVNAGTTINVTPSTMRRWLRAASLHGRRGRGHRQRAVTATDATGCDVHLRAQRCRSAGLTFNSNGTYSFNPANAAYQSLGVGQQPSSRCPIP